MKKDNKQRLFEVMGRLDKTFKPKLNEGFEEELPAETGAETLPAETGEEAPESLQEWNFDKKKGEKKDEEEKEEGEESEKPEEKKELDEAKPKVPVAAIAKVGK